MLIFVDIRLDIMLHVFLLTLQSKLLLLPSALTYSVVFFDFREDAFVTSELLCHFFSRYLLDFGVDVNVNDCSEDFVSRHFQVFGKYRRLLWSSSDCNLV